MNTFGKVLVASGLLLLISGGIVLLLSRLGVHDLPGDIVVRRPHLTLYVPLGLMIVVSVALTIILNLSSRR